MVDKKVLILGIVVALLLVSTIGVYTMLNSKVTDLTGQVSTLEGEKSNLQTELQSSKDSLASTEADFSDYKGIFKSYFSLNKVIAEDVVALLETVTDFSDEVNKVKRKPIAEKYESQLNTMKNHISEYTTLLNDNKADFEEASVDVGKQTKAYDDVVPAYDNILTEMNKLIG